MVCGMFGKWYMVYDLIYGIWYMVYNLINIIWYGIVWFNCYGVWSGMVWSYDCKASNYFPNSAFLNTVILEN